MTRGKLGFRKSFREQIEAANKADRYYALMAGKEPQNQTVLPPKRERAAPRKLEAPVVAAISELLAVHPRVIWAARFNSGMASYDAGTRKYAPVWFHKFLRSPEKMRMPDFFGLYLDKKLYPTDLQVVNVRQVMLPIAIEAKAPGWSKPRDDREREQAAFLAMVRNAGGIGIFATSAEQVAEALR